MFFYRIDVCPSDSLLVRRLKVFFGNVDHCFSGTSGPTDAGSGTRIQRTGAEEWCETISVKTWVSCVKQTVTAGAMSALNGSCVC